MATVVDQAKDLAKAMREVALQSRRIKIPASGRGGLAPIAGIDTVEIRRSEM